MQWHRALLSSDAHLQYHSATFLAHCNNVIEFILLDSVVDMAEAKLLQHNLMNEPSVHRMYDMCSYHVKSILSKFCNAFIRAG